MAYIEMEDLVNGEPRLVRHEAPPGPAGETAIAYLRPSGATVANPLHGWEERVADQQWLYDPGEAAHWQQHAPERYVRTRT